MPTPPPPSAEAVAACVQHKVDEACSFEFREHTITGACRMGPDGKTLVCAPVCRH
jgi:hypothetical protein